MEKEYKQREVHNFFQLAIEALFRQGLFKQEMTASFINIFNSSLHWLILVLFHALFVQWSIFPLTKIFKHSEYTEPFMTCLYTYSLEHSFAVSIHFLQCIHCLLNYFFCFQRFGNIFDGALSLSVSEIKTLG